MQFSRRSIGRSGLRSFWLKTNIPIIGWCMVSFVNKLNGHMSETLLPTSTLQSTAISSVEDRNLIIEAINHGAYFVLVRPVRIDKMQRIWPFVLVHRRWALARNQESASREAKDQCSRNEEGARGCKRSESNSEEVNQPHSHRNLMKKSHLVWTDERKRQFLKILQRFGEKNVTPKRIAELMNEPEFTNVNVSSHLQKYWLCLKKAKDAAMAASAQQGRKNSEASESVSSNVKRRVGINEPIQIHTEDVARQIAQYSKPNTASLPIVNVEWQTPGLGEWPSGYCLCHSHCGVQNLERRSRDVSYDQISSALRLRQMIMDRGILGTTQETGESSRGNWNAQNNWTEDPVGNGSPNLDKSPEGSTAKMPSPRSSDSRDDTNHPETTDGEEAYPLALIVMASVVTVQGNKDLLSTSSSQT